MTHQKCPADLDRTIDQSWGGSMFGCLGCLPERNLMHCTVGVAGNLWQEVMITCGGQVTSGMRLTCRGDLWRVPYDGRLAWYRGVSCEEPVTLN